MARYLAVALARMSAEVRSGWVPAKKTAIGLASTWASKAACSEPTSSRTATRSWAYVSHGGSESSGRGSEAPVPLRSNMISRENEASVRKNRAMPGSSQAMSTWPKLPVVITRSGGPSPNT